MTAKQNSLYWRAWAGAKRAASLEDSDRHALHVRALGSDKSHADFSERDFDLVLAEFRALSDPTNLTDQVAALNQPLIRLRFRIRKEASPEYIKTLLAERFAWAVWLRNTYPKHAGWTMKAAPPDILSEFRESHSAPILEDLKEEELTQLRNTLAARAAAKRREHRRITRHRRAGGPCQVVGANARPTGDPEAWTETQGSTRTEV